MTNSEHELEFTFAKKWLISHQQTFSGEMSSSTPTKHDGRAVFAVAELLVANCQPARGIASLAREGKGMPPSGEFEGIFTGKWLC